MFAIFLAIFALFSWTATGQSTTAVCLATYSWASNSLKQSPCLVASYLETACLPNPAIIPAVPPGNHYLGPNFLEADPCKCSTVVYNLMSACGACQGRNWANWTTWALDCTTITIGYPKAIPTAVTVPSWAYIDVTVTSTFDPVQAENNLTSSLTTSASPSSSSSFTFASVPTPSDSIGGPAPVVAENSSSSVNAGAIAGGVVGGIAFIVLAALGFFAYSRRRKTHEVDNPSTVYDPDGKSFSRYGSPSTQPTPFNIYETSERSMSPQPLSPVTSGVYTTFAARSSWETVPQLQHGIYSGAPEV
ncbi:hypothetical protein C8J56DRAFT_256273 [Mycena floridula]|nr:hypothetical protein C8J56DRAFT_256273 [Mycena floridula]